MKINKMFRVCVCVICFVIIVISMCVLIAVSAYSVPASDDFAFSVNVHQHQYENDSLFARSLKFAGDCYKKVHGVFFSDFISSFLMPLNQNGYVQLKATMIMNMVLLIVAFSLLAAEVLRYLSSGFLKLVVYTLLLFSCFWLRGYQELFTWFSGATTYCIPISCFLLSLYLLIKAVKNRSKGYQIFSLLLGALAMGGSLELAGAACWIALSIIICEIIDKKVNPVVLVYFLTLLCFAMINTLAPGNYIRHDIIAESYGIKSSYSIIKAVFGSVSTFASNATWLFTETDFIGVALFMLVIGMLSEMKIKGNTLFILTGLLVLTPIIACFPVVLGYSRVSIPNRVQLILDWTVELPLLFLFFLIGCKLRDLNKNNNSLSLFAFVVASCFMFSNSVRISDTAIAWQMSHIKEVRQYHDECISLLEDIEDTNESVVCCKLPIEVPALKSFELYEDSNDWVNVAIANYLNKEAVVVSNQ